MDDVLYKRFLSKISFTKNRSFLRCFDSGSESRGDVSATVESVWCTNRNPDTEKWHAEEDDTLEWLRANYVPTPKDTTLFPSSTRPGALRLVVARGDRWTPFSTSESFFTRVIETCKYPRLFPQSICTNNGSFARFVEYEDIEGSLRPISLSVIVQTPNSPVRNFSVVIRVNVTDRSATGLFLEGDDLRIDDLFQRLQAQRAVLQCNPLAFLSIVFEEHGYSCEQYRGELDSNVAEMERQTGHTSLSVRIFQDQPGYETLIKRLNACNTSLIFMEVITAFERDLGAFCKGTFETLEDLRRKRGLSILPAGQLAAAVEAMDYHLNLSQMRRSQSLALQKRVQLQLTVLYSLISQRDSKVNILVAEDSKKIALAAKRDSTAMKTISVLTLVFLPGTFVASIFSSGIFNFQGSETGAAVIVSEMWWVYFVLTGCLTLFTIAMWAWYIQWRSAENKREEEKLEKTA